MNYLMTFLWSEANRAENPLSWRIRYLFVLVAYPLMAFAGIVLFMLCMPPVLICMYFANRRSRRTAGVFSDAGIYFPKAYHKVTVAWSEVRAIVRQREPKALYNRIVCEAPKKQPEYVMCSTQDDEAFERTVAERGIPFRVQDRFGQAEEAPRLVYLIVAREERPTMNQLHALRNFTEFQKCNLLQIREALQSSDVQLGPFPAAVAQKVFLRTFEDNGLKARVRELTEEDKATRARPE